MREITSFAAIDFETANNYRTSICSVGLVVVENGEITDRIHELIRPTPNYFLPRNTEIHGISAADTYEAPTFPDVWEEIEPRIKHLPLFAHNKAFDEGCLRAVFSAYEIYYPEYEFYCTYQLARRCFPYLFNHKLPTVARHCGYELEHHHHALADAEACAAIALEVIDRMPR